MLTASMSAAVERVQRLALKTIFGFEKHYCDVLAESQLESLEERRIRALGNFTHRTVKDPKYSARWFPQRTKVNMDLRVKADFQEEFAKTERCYRSPIYAMRRILNNK